MSKKINVVVTRIVDCCLKCPVEYDKDGIDYCYHRDIDAGNGRKIIWPKPDSNNHIPDFPEWCLLSDAIGGSLK